MRLRRKPADTSGLSRNVRKLRDVAHLIKNADTCLHRGQAFSSLLIQVGGRSRYSHASKVGWCGTELMLAEVREWYGGRVVSLASQVEQSPGLIDVYETNPQNMHPNYDRDAAWQCMLRMAGCQYGWGHILGAAACHLPFVRIINHLRHPPDAPDRPRSPKTPPFCSEAVSYCDRTCGGVDPVRNLPDHLTEPGDIARSDLYIYRFTLVP